jgi:hypothetical protein
VDERGPSDQNQPYDPQQQPFGYQPYGGATRPGWQVPPQAPGKPKKTGRRIAQFGCLGTVALIVIIVIAAAVGSSGTNGSTAGSNSPAAAATTQAAPGAAPAVAAPPATTAAPAEAIVLTTSGNGQLTTRPFTVGNDWALTYSFNCANFGGQGNFQVYEDYPNGNILANALAANGGNTTYQTGDAGTHTLEVNSECDWKITVTDNDSGQG